jgi:hypothetical protein
MIIDILAIFAIRCNIKAKRIDEIANSWRELQPVM